MDKLIYIFVLLVITFFSCNAKHGKEIISNNDKIEIELPYKVDLNSVIGSSKDLYVSSISGNISYIPLETNTNCLLRRIHDFTFFGNNILVSDFSNLYQFDSEGNFIKRVSQKGEGPSDYVFINTILSNETTHLFNLFTAGKINMYDENLKYVKSIPYAERYYAGTITSWGNYFMFLGSKFKKSDDTTTVYSFNEINPMGKIVNRIPNLSPIVATYPGMVVGNIPIYKYQDYTRFMDYGNDTLFTYAINGLKIPFAICDLGNMKREVNTSGYNPKQIEALSSKLLVSNICEDDQYLYITLSWGMTEKQQYCLFDKNSSKLVNVGSKGLKNDIDGGISFFPQYITNDGSKVMWISAEDFINESQKSNSKIVKEILTRIKEDDNPVCIIIK